MADIPSGPGNPEGQPGDDASWVAEFARDAARSARSGSGGNPADGLVIVAFPANANVDALVDVAVETIESEGVSAQALAWPAAAKAGIAEARRTRESGTWNVLAVDSDFDAASALADTIQDWIDSEKGTEGPRIVKP